MSENVRVFQKMFEDLGGFREKLFLVLEKIDRESFLDREKGAGSVRDLLAHIVDAEDYWVGSVIMGEKRRRFSPEKYEDATSLKKDRDKIHERTTKLLSTLSQQLLAERRTVELDQKSSLDVERILWYLVAHELHHNGQICLLLRQKGHEPPEMDVS